jgi:uncharacterized protein (DUF486 family)
MIKTIVLLIISNIFMTLAWCGHLKYGFAQKVRIQLTPKAFANFSPGLELATTLGPCNETINKR